MWHARVVRTRSAAAALVDGGCVRVNGAKTGAASHLVRPGDVVTVALDRGVRVLKVLGYAERRGSADEARVLFEDLSEPAPPRPDRPAGMRDRGAGRPTKRDRRQIDRLRTLDES